MFGQSLETTTFRARCRDDHRTQQPWLHAAGTHPIDIPPIKSSTLLDLNTSPS